jgi:hypothetical protein
MKQLYIKTRLKNARQAVLGGAVGGRFMVCFFVGVEGGGEKDRHILQENTC